MVTNGGRWAAMPSNCARMFFNFSESGSGVARVRLNAHSARPVFSAYTWPSSGTAGGSKGRALRSGT